MNDNGYVYVLMNPSLKNMVKIGKTTREPEERAKELSAATGVPTPFIVVYSCLFESCTEAESFVHTYLESNGFRVASNREFFEIPINIGIDAVIKAKEHFGEFIKDSNDKNKEILDKPFEEYELIAKNYTHGENGYVQDIRKAIEYHNIAIKLGSTSSLKDLSDIYSGIIFESDIKPDYDKAIEYYNRYLEFKNSPHCYMSIVFCYFMKGFINNSLITLIKMFSEKRFNLTSVRDTSLFLNFGRFYLKKDFDMVKVDFEYIISESDAVISHLKLLNELKETINEYCNKLENQYSNLLQEHSENDFIITNVNEEIEALNSIKSYITLINNKIENPFPTKLS